MTSACEPPVCPGCRAIFGRYTQAVIEKGSPPVRPIPGNVIGDLSPNFNARRPLHGETSSDVTPAFERRSG